MNKNLISLIHTKVNVLLVENKISVAGLCSHIGMTANGYNKMWKNRSIKMETILKIADFFELPLHYFISTESNNLETSYKTESSGSGVEEIREKYIKALESENRLLKKLLDEKEK